MPRRKRSNLSQSSSGARRMRLIRSQELDAEHEERLAHERERRKHSRSSESASQNEDRLTSERERRADSRASESASQREDRLNSDRKRHAEYRASESASQYEERLSIERQRRVDSRESETFTQYQDRLSCERERREDSRESETFTQYQGRLSYECERRADSRESETFTQYQDRLSYERERRADSRESETFTQYQDRLSYECERRADSRESETFTQYQDRLSYERERRTDSRESETFTQYQDRLSYERERRADSRETETFTQYQGRLSYERERRANSRESETFTQYESRLSYERERRSNSQMFESDHRSHVRDHVNELRFTQSNTQREVRRASDRQRHSVYRFSDTDNMPWSSKERSGFTYNPSISYACETHVGPMSEVCQHCKALKWKGEPNGMCCSSGKVKIETFADPPEPLKSLLNGKNSNSKHFLESIRAYNSAFQMTSFGAKQVCEPGFMPTFKIQGQVYHLIGSLLPVQEPKFLQIYFISDYQEQASVRQQHIPNLNTKIIVELQNMLHQVHRYITSFKAALESVPESEHDNYKFVVSADRRPPAAHSGRYNAPTSNEVAVLMVNEECDRRDIVLYTRDNNLHRISETHRAYDALQYPLIYCHGEDGYHFGIYNVNPETGACNYNKKTSALQFYCYLLQLRQDKNVFLHRFKQLFSQFLVDMYAKIETERLVFIRTNQCQLRAENYINLRDAMQNDEDIENLGSAVILPSTFTGGPRYMHERTQDALCYVRKYGGPDLFITFTTNPKWPEIASVLLPGQTPTDRHDIVSRIFHLKQKRLIDLLTKQKIYGSVRCYIYTIEWQKRGLPHSHTLLWLDEKVRPNDIDSIICAELPDPENDPCLHQIVKAHMIHGPCGIVNPNSPCMIDGHCMKRFPKTFVTNTITGENGYPEYRRRSPRQGGSTTVINSRGQSMEVDNRWVVPYSPVLSRAFETHINVESCASIASIKYVLKYVNKGSDQATFGIQQETQDEVTAYQSGRYISTSEAVWRMLSFHIHERYPTVMHLDVHLENGQRVYFDPSRHADVRERLNNPRPTTLLAFFKVCQEDDFARNLMYDEVPSYYTYNKQLGTFNRRRRGQPIQGVPGILKEHALGRVYTIHPNNKDCYYLRLLLLNVRGPTSFAFLKTVDGIEYPTFRAACNARNLLHDDKNWDDTLAEAIVCDSPSRLRHLFAIMLVYCGLANPVQLWEKYRSHLSEDILWLAEHNGDNSNDRIVNRCLYILQDIVIRIGGDTLDKYGLSVPQEQPDQPRINHEYASEMNYDASEMTTIVRDNLPKLTLEQRIVYDKVLESVELCAGELFFLDAPGGTGKTFVTKIILAEIRRQKKISLAVASSGIAATLLPGGKTAHRTFKIPTNLNATESPICDVPRNSHKARVIQDCHLIVWDECTMAHKKAVEAVDRMLRDTRRNERAMGGITVLFCGDFRQTLPVITRGTRADEVGACLKRSILWPNIKKLILTQNMRVQQLRANSESTSEFSNILLKVGEGKLPNINGLIQLPQTLCRVVQSVEELINKVYGSVHQITEMENSWLCERAILTPKNEQVAAINQRILNAVAGEKTIYASTNTVLDSDNSTLFPTEFLDSINVSGLPAHLISLKVGVPIMLLRNLAPPKLCNGTRLKTLSLQRNLIEAEILTGCGAGKSVLIPRIPMIPNNFPFQFRRVQFPVSVCFAMTVNKSQGQTLQAAGVDLRTGCFSHGQLYVACSRVACAGHLYILAPQGYTTNVVYREIL